MRMTALGLMSGTSLDGIDAAVLDTDGVEIFGFGEGGERPYSEGEIAAITAVMADPMAYRGAETGGLAAEIRQANLDVDALHASAAAHVMTLAETAVELIGYHGQTVAHAPDEGWTWQLGDGARLARSLNRPVVWDFRSADMEAGGEGAPLAPFYHWALARWIGAEAPVAFLNIGGVGNVTWVDPTKPTPEAEGALVAFDTGPGNALLNDWMLGHTGAPMDRDGAAAAAGVFDQDMVRGGNAMASYVRKPPPKSLDRNTFAAMLDLVSDLSVEDGAATLTALTAECVAAAETFMPSPPSRWLICGGGRKNATMMSWIAERLSAPVEPVEAAGLDGDLLEAQAFAYLAVRALRGLPLSSPGTTGCRAPTTGGRVAKPVT